MLKRIDHIGVVVDDLQAGRRFLETLGLRHDRDIEVPDRGLKASFYRCGDVSVEIIQLDDRAANRERMKGESMARIEHIAIEVDDIDKTVDDLSERGVEVTAAPTRVGPSISVWTKPETSDGYQFQFLQKGS